MSRPSMTGRSEASMRTKSTCLRNLMAEKDIQHAKRLAEEKEAEEQRAEAARHLSTPGSWIDEDTVTPKQPYYYFPDTPDAPEKNDAVGRKALVQGAVAKDAGRLKRQQIPTVITPTLKPGFDVIANGISKNRVPPKKSDIRVNPDGQRDAVKKASASADQRTSKETPTPQVLGKHLNSSRIAKPNAARLPMTVREAENAYQAKIEIAEAEYMEGRCRFEIASGGMLFNMMWESDAKFHFLEDQEYYGPLLKKIEEWKVVRDWYRAKLAALKARYSKPAPRIQTLRKKDSPNSARTQSIAVEKPAHIKSTRERFEAYRTFESANSQHVLKEEVANSKGYITIEQARELSEALCARRKATPHQGLLVAPDLFDPPELGDHPAPRYARASDESKHVNQSTLTFSNGVEDTASQHALPLKQSHANDSRYVEPAPMEPVQVEEHALQEPKQPSLTTSTETEGTVSHPTFNLEQSYAQASHSVEPASSEPAQVDDTASLSKQATLTPRTEYEGHASQHALHLKQLRAQAAQYVEAASSEPVAMGEEALPQREQSDVTSPEPVNHALSEGRWSNHKCNMKYCRAYFSFAKDYEDRGVFNGRPSVLGKRSVDHILSIEEQDLETRRVRQKNKIFGQEVVHVLAEGFHKPIKVRAPKGQRARGVEYLPAPSTPFESQISAVNGVQDHGESEYRKAMDLYEGGLYFGAEGLEGKDDHATNSGGAMVIDEGEGIEEGEEVHGYVERFLSDPISHNGVYFIHRNSGFGDMIKIDVPRDVWLRQNDHNEDNLDRADIYVLIQLCEIVRHDNKLLSSMDPHVAGQRVRSDLHMLLQAFTKFANSNSWIDRWTIRRQVRGLLEELRKFSTAIDRDIDHMMQHLVEGLDGPIAHTLKALRAILAATENDKNQPTSREAPRRTFTSEELEEALDAILQEECPPTHPQTLLDDEEEALENTTSNVGGAHGPPAIVPMGPREGRCEGRDRGDNVRIAGTNAAGNSARKNQGTAARDSNSRTVADANTARSRDVSMMEASTGVPIGAPTGPRADKGKAPMRPESVDHDSDMRDAPNERLERPENGEKPATSSTFGQSRKNGVPRIFLTPGETDQDMLDAEAALNLDPRDFSGIAQALVEPQKMEIENFDTNGNEADEMETDLPLRNSFGPPLHAPRGPLRQQSQGPKHRSSNMPPRLDFTNAPSGPSRRRNPESGIRRTSMPPRRNEHTEGRFGNEEQDSRRGRSETRDEQPRRQNPRSREREERARRQEEGQSNGAFSSDPRRQHGYSEQQRPERPLRSLNPNAGLAQQRLLNQPDRKAAHPQQGFRNADDNHRLPPFGRNGSSAGQTQGNVDAYAQARLQNNQNRHNQNRLRSNAVSGGRAQIEDNAPESGHSFLGAARKNRPNSQN